MSILRPAVNSANYYRHVVAKKTYTQVDYQVFLALLAWVNRRHPNKSMQWKRKRYFRSQYRRQWVFFAPTHDKQGKVTQLDLFHAGRVAITRHLKIRVDATPYDPAFMTTSRADCAREESIRLSGPGL